MAEGLCVITGAAGGIGRALAQRLSDDGRHLHLIDVETEPLQALAEALPGPTSWAQSRLASPQACADALPTPIREISAFIHLAGIFVPHELGPGSETTYTDTFQHNAKNAYDMAGAIVPHMGDGGRMVFVSSLGFNRGVPDHTAYAMAKGAIVGLTRSLSRALGKRRICVNAVAPGIIETPMIDGLVATRGRDALLKTIPLRRFGAPGDVAGVIAFLLSQDAAYVTGQVINVDGGVING